MRSKVGRRVCAGGGSFDIVDFMVRILTGRLLHKEPTRGFGFGCIANSTDGCIE